MCLKGQPREASCPLDPSPRPLCASSLCILPLVSCPSLSADYGRCQMPHVAPDIDCHRRLHNHSMSLFCLHNEQFPINYSSAHLSLEQPQRGASYAPHWLCCPTLNSFPPLYVREKQIEAERSLLLFSSFIKKRKRLGW